MKYIDNQLKAKIIKLKDANNNYTSENVEDALEEIDSKIKKNTNNIDTLKANDHSHENKSILDNISQDDIDAWNAKTSGGEGTATNLTIGSVTTLAAGSNATASITGVAPDLTLNLGIPKGDKGDTGAKGQDGLTTKISMNGTTYTHVGGTITLPNCATETFVTNKINEALSQGTGNNGNISVSYDEINEELTFGGTASIEYDENEESLTIGGIVN